MTLDPRMEQDGLALVAVATGLAVVDEDSFELAGEHLKSVKEYQRRVHDVFDPVVAAAFAAHRVAVEQRKSLLVHANSAEHTLKQRMAHFEQEQARRRREAEEAAARERERLEREERERVAIEEQRLRREAEERRLVEAVAAEASGDRTRAEALLEAPVLVASVVPRPVFVAATPVAPPRLDGISFREQWSAEVVSLAELVQAVASGRAPITLLKPDEVALNAMARALKGAMAVPGVRVRSERIAAVRS
jgi:hypothetical protein